MKLSILTCTGVVFGHADDSHATSANDDLGNDIRLTPCQAEKFTALGYQVDAFGPKEDNAAACGQREKAQSKFSTKWDSNWSERYMIILFENLCLQSKVALRRK